MAQGAESDGRVFPFLGGGFPDFPGLPWAMVAPHEKQAINNHGQPLEKLARRGGLSFDEMLFVIEDRDLPRLFKRDPQAPVKLAAHLDGWRRRRGKS